jgi:hypothetical protein
MLWIDFHSDEHARSWRSRFKEDGDVRLSADLKRSTAVVWGFVFQFSPQFAVDVIQTIFLGTVSTWAAIMGIAVHRRSTPSAGTEH